MEVSGILKNKQKLISADKIDMYCFLSAWMELFLLFLRIWQNFIRKVVILHIEGPQKNPEKCLKLLFSVEDVDDDVEADRDEVTSGPSNCEKKRQDLKRSEAVSRQEKPEMAGPAKAATGSSEIFAGKSFLLYGPFDQDERQELNRSD